MNRTLRAFTLGLMLGTAGMAAAPFVAVTPAMAQSSSLSPSAERSVGWYQEMAEKMDRRTIRQHIDFLKANRSKANKQETRAKLDILRAARKQIMTGKPTNADNAGAPKSSEQQQQKKKRQKKQQTQQEQTQQQQQSTQQGSGTLSQSSQQSADDSLAKVEKAARQFLDDAKVSSELNRSQLRERMSRTDEMLAWKGIEDRTRQRLKRLRANDEAALESRTSSASSSDSQDLKPSNETERKAEGILSDNRSADDLNEKELRERVERNRDLLRQGKVDDRYNSRMRDRLRADRQELRRLVRDRRDDTNRNTDWAAYDRRLVAGDVRHAQDLRPNQIRDRIDRTRNLLDRRDLTNRERNRLLALLDDDRRELRNRFRDRRGHRRSELDRWLRDNQINIVIAPPSAYAPRDDIAFAEVDDTMIERQLIAPPRRRIDERYSFREFRERPDLRTAMPAIDIDSINFGFDEAFVRAEEIDELERLGAIVERIVAKNPDEVFVIEGHTDAVGSPEYNLGLSQRRADAVRSALLEYFVIEPRNLESVGYGEQYLKIPTPEEEQENRRVTIRRITPLISQR